jgi:hypothetical protein
MARRSAAFRVAAAGADDRAPDGSDGRGPRWSVLCSSSRAARWPNCRTCSDELRNLQRVLPRRHPMGAAQRSRLAGCRTGPAPLGRPIDGAAALLVTESRTGRRALAGDRSGLQRWRPGARGARWCSVMHEPRSLNPAARRRCWPASSRSTRCRASVAGSRGRRDGAPIDRTPGGDRGRRRPGA